MKILIVEPYSLIGYNLFNFLTKEFDDVYGVTLNESQFQSNPHSNIFFENFLDKKILKKIIHETLPAYVINGYSYNSSVHFNKKKAWNGNVTLAENLAKQSIINDFHLVSFSDDCIFDGRQGPYDESGLPNPQSYYGKSRHAGDNNIMANVSDFTLLRHSMLYGIGIENNNFIFNAISELSKGNNVKADESSFYTPTFIDDLILCVYKLISKKRSGIYHISSSELLSEFDICTAICEVFSFSPALIKKYSSGEKKKYGFINLKAETDLNIKFASIRNGLESLKFQIIKNKLLEL